MMVAAEPVRSAPDALLADEQHRVSTGVLDAHYVDLALRKLRERHAFNAAMISCLEGRGGSLEDFAAWSAAHEAATAGVGGALVCLGELQTCKGIC